MHRNEWKHNNPKSIGFSKSRAMGNVHSNTSLLKKQEKSQIKNLTLHLKQLEKEEMKKPRVSNGTPLRTLAWKIPWMEEPGRLQSMGSLRVGHDWPTSLSLFTFMHWRRKWQSTPVFLPGEPQGQQSLVGCRLWGHIELDTTEVT